MPLSGTGVEPAVAFSTAGSTATMTVTCPGAGPSCSGSMTLTARQGIVASGSYSRSAGRTEALTTALALTAAACACWRSSTA